MLFRSFDSVKKHTMLDPIPISVEAASRGLSLAFQAIPLPLPLVILPSRVFDVDVGATSARTAQTAAEPPGQPALHRSRPLDIDQYSATIYFLTIRMLIRS